MDRIICVLETFVCVRACVCVCAFLCLFALCLYGPSQSTIFQSCIPSRLAEDKVSSGSMAFLAWRLVCWWDGGGLVLSLLLGLLWFACWISFAPVFSFIYCWVLIFALFPFCVLVCVFWGMVRWWVGGPVVRARHLCVLVCVCTRGGVGAPLN